MEVKKIPEFSQTPFQKTQQEQVRICGPRAESRLVDGKLLRRNTRG